ncbi:MAG: hypothetical protein R3B84_17185 [Zavarzinella sp.]
MDPEYICEIYILYLIDSLDNTTQQQFMKMLQSMNAPYDSIDKFLREYEAEESIYVDLIKWIKDEWASSQKHHPNISAKQFAKEKVPDFMSSLS